MNYTQCTCGERFQAATTEAAWILLDAHCDLAHGRRFSVGARHKGELSMTPSAIAKRRLVAERGHW